MMGELMTERPDVAEDRAHEWWYAACGNCMAKWFATFEPQRCPRCGQCIEIVEQRSPPWSCTTTSMSKKEPPLFVKELE